MADAAPEPTDQNNFATVVFGKPIKRGATEIASITLRKPKAGELRGLALQDLLTTDVAAILKVIPRISSPPLTQHEADELEADDLTECAGAIRGFFMTSGERQVLEAMIAEHQPKT